MKLQNSFFSIVPRRKDKSAICCKMHLMGSSKMVIIHFCNSCCLAAAQCTVNYFGAGVAKNKQYILMLQRLELILYLWPRKKNCISDLISKQIVKSTCIFFCDILFILFCTFFNYELEIR